ncbi:MAG: hypothetical protein II915_04595 [Eubacterium sp.]|nr:hypothetical protein [Eubacterium sp.]
MKSDVITIDNQGKGIDAAKLETEKAAQFRNLDNKQSLRLQLCAEEMLSLARSVTGEMEASFWVESEDKHFELHMTTKTVMDKLKRETLLAASTSGKNEAAKTFLGNLRNAFVEAMISDTDKYVYTPDLNIDDTANRYIESEEWDQYEQSVLRAVADGIKVSIVGKTVDLTVVKDF